MSFWAKDRKIGPIWVESFPISFFPVASSKKYYHSTTFCYWQKIKHTRFQFKSKVASYSNESVSYKWEWPLLHPSSLCVAPFFGARKEARRKLSFEWKIIILIGHYTCSIERSWNGGGCGILCHKRSNSINNEESFLLRVVFFAWNKRERATSILHAAFTKGLIFLENHVKVLTYSFTECSLLEICLDFKHVNTSKEWFALKVHFVIQKNKAQIKIYH